MAGCIVAGRPLAPILAHAHALSLYNALLLNNALSVCNTLLAMLKKSAY